MSLTDANYWIDSDSPPRLVVRAGRIEKLLRAFGRAALRTAVRMRERRIERAELVLLRELDGGPTHERGDIGRPPTITIMDVTQYR